MGRERAHRGRRTAIAGHLSGLERMKGLINGRCRGCPGPLTLPGLFIHCNMSQDHYKEVLGRTVTLVRRDATYTFPCRAGDLLLWFRWSDLFGKGRLNVLDLWLMNAGERVLLTNRLDDIPDWLELAPKELSIANEMILDKFVERFGPLDMDRPVMQAPEIWRPRAGDRIVWTGPSRPGHEEDAGVLQHFVFDVDCLFLMEPLRNPLSDDLDDAVLNDPRTINRAQSAERAVRDLGIPRVASASSTWKIRL